MTYASNELNRTGIPIELVAFIGEGLDYRMTTASSDITYDGNTYTSTVVSVPNVIETSSDPSKMKTEFKLPRSHELSQLWIAGMLRQKIYVTLFRGYQSDMDFVVVWSGSVSSVSINDDEMVITCESVISSAGSGYRLRILRLCPLPLYDEDTCKVVKSVHRVTSVVNTVLSTKQIEVTAADALADGWFTSGSVKFISGANNGMSFMITSHVGAVLTLLTDAVGVSVNDAIELLPGCDHTLSTCRSKFSNGDNSLAFPHLPVANPFGNIPLA